jgi:hypothetical protein
MSIETETRLLAEKMSPEQLVLALRRVGRRLETEERERECKKLEVQRGVYQAQLQELGLRICPKCQSAPAPLDCVCEACAVRSGGGLGS